MKQMRIGNILAVSVWLAVFLVAIISQPPITWAAVDTGGYPWANAVAIRPATYEWGYTSCQPAMQAANKCKGFTTTKLGRTYYYSDPWRYYVRNCTSYVAWRVQSELGVAIPGWGNANNWDNMAQKLGYRVDNTPAIGAIAVWERNYGHVAYVTGVNLDGSVNIEQYNQFGTGTFSRQSRVRAVHYIHIKDLVPAAVSPVPAAVSVPTTPLSTQPSISTENPAPLSVPEVPIQPPVVPLQPLKASGQKLFPERSDAVFIPTVQPITDQVNVYGVQWNNTASRKVEISRTDSSDGNSAWVETWVTPIPTSSENGVRYDFADANADGYVDLYILRKSGMSILSGKDKFVSPLEQAELPTSSITDGSTLSLADYDGNGSLDLFIINKNEQTTSISILDGTRQFGQLVAQWIAPHASSENVQYRVGDHDRDGRVDLYEIGSEIQVYSGSDNYQQAAHSWKQDQSLSAINNSLVTVAATPAP